MQDSEFEIMDRFQNLQKLRLPARPPDARSHLERVLEALVNDYGAERIIAFGSCVHGEATEHSDVDLCVIREHPPECTHPHLEALTALKSWLIGRGWALIKTHDLQRLINECACQGMSLSWFESSARRLQSLYFTDRYVDDSPPRAGCGRSGRAVGRR